MEVTKEFIEDMKKYDKPEDPNMGLVEACASNPVIFAKRMLGIDLFAWQKKTIMEVEENEEAKYYPIVCSRQIGKTELAAIYSLWAALFNKHPTGLKQTSDVGVIAAQDDQAKNLIERIRERIEMANTHLNMKYTDDEGDPLFGEDFFRELVDDKKANNTSTITFKTPDDINGPDEFFKGAKGNVQIRSFPPTRVVRGKTFGLVIVDEAGISDKITEGFFKKTLKPTGDKSGAPFLLLSTPQRPEGIFYKFVNPDGTYEERDDVKSLSFTIDAIQHEDTERWKRLKKEIEREEKEGNSNAMRQEYYCEFVKTADTFFNPDAVRRVFENNLVKQYEHEEPCDMGVDFGGEKSSKSCITISTFDEIDEEIKRLYHKTYEPGEDEDLLKDIKSLKTRFNIHRIVVDDCPAGQFLINKMEKKGWNITRMSFRKEKVEKYTAFRSQVNSKNVLSYEDDDLQAEMMALENRPTRSRTVIGAPQGQTDDLVDSFVMSTYYYIEEDDITGLINVHDAKDKIAQKHRRVDNEESTLEKIRQRRKYKGRSGDSWYFNR